MKPSRIDIQALANLDDGWNGYCAPPIPQPAIDKTLHLLDEGLFEGLDVEVFPTGRESIQIEYQDKVGGYLEIEVHEKWIGALMEYPQKGTIESDSVTIEEVRQLVTVFKSYSLPDPSPGSSTKAQ